MAKDECLGCNYVSEKQVNLRDGRVVCSTCPDWLLETEARRVLAMSDKKARSNYLAGVDKQRGKVSGDKLRAEVMAQWEAQKAAKC